MSSIIHLAIWIMIFIASIFAGALYETLADNMKWNISEKNIFKNSLLTFFATFIVLITFYILIF